ncbi:MAG: hypothetical protein ACTSWW_08680 [Promethearchaeota archaeon]
MNTLQLWKISKISYREAFTAATLAQAGSNQAKILEKMGKNRSYMKTQSIGMKIAMIIYLGMMIILPIQAFNTIRTGVDVDPSWMLFTGSITLSLYFLMQMMYLIMFGMFFASSLLSGEIFKWLATLPLKKKEIQKVALFTFFRGVDVEFWTLLIVFPLGTAIASQSLTVTLACIVISILNIVFSFGILIVIGEKVNRILNDSHNTKRANRARLTVMILYILSTLTVAIGVQMAIMAIPGFIANQTIPSATTDTINLIGSLIPFPLNAGYWLISLFIGWSTISLGMQLTLVLGFILFCLVTVKLFKHALCLFGNITNPEKIKASDEIELVQTTLSDVTLHIQTPEKAFFTKDKKATTRDIQMMMMVVMPIILPVIGYFSMAGALGEDAGMELLLTIFSTNLLYLFMSGAMIILGILSAESSGATILASLPIITRDQAKAKLRFVFLILPIASAVQAIFYIGKPTFGIMLSLSLITLPIGIGVGVINLLLKARMFGKMKYKYVLDEVQIKAKFWKYVLQVVLNIALYVVVLVVIISYMGDFTSDSMGELAILLIPLEIGGGILLYWIFNRMFPKAKSYA